MPQPSFLSSTLAMFSFAGVANVVFKLLAKRRSRSTCARTAVASAAAAAEKRTLMAKPVVTADAG
jgi:hypothetical protein